MDGSSITKAGLQQLYQEPISKSTEIFSAREVEEDIQAGKQISQEQMNVLNNYWQMAGRQKIAGQPAQQEVEILPLQTRENVSFFTKMKNKLASWFPKKSAKGTPVQEQSPQKFTVKQKEADRVRDKIAGRHNSCADHVSYEMLRQLNTNAYDKSTTMEAAKKAGMNIPDSIYRTLLAYVHGFRGDKNGNPLTKKDQRLKEENLTWLGKYLSADKEEHFAALDQSMDEILNFNIKPAMLKDKYIEKHLFELRKFSSWLLCLENLHRESETNQEYFQQAIEPKKKELLDARDEQLNKLLAVTINDCAARKGVDWNRAQYFDVSKGNMEVIIAQSAMEVKTFHPEENFKQLAKKEKMVAEFEKRVGKQETKIKKQLSKQSKETKENKTNVGIAASDAARVRTLASNIDERIAENPQMAERYKKSIDALSSEITKETNLRDEAGIQIAACAELQKEIADRKKAKKKVTPEEEQMGDLARRQENFLRVYRENQHIRNIAICGNAVRFFLTGEKLGDDALKLIKRLGLNDDLTGKNEELIFAGDGESTGGRI